MNNFEKKFGRYAINNISLYLVIGYAIGYVTQILFPALANYLTLEPYYILHGQIWRLVTWIIMPPSSSNIFFLAIMMLFYYNVGRALESVWGTYRLNAYLFCGMIYTIIGAFVLYGILYAVNGAPVTGFGSLFTTYYVNMSIFLAYAVTFPEMQVLLMFFIPIRVKYLGILYLVMLGAQCLEAMSYGFAYGLLMTVAVCCSLLNFFIYYWQVRKGKLLNRAQRQTRGNFKAQSRTTAYGNITRHKCAICGRTEESNPSLEFRFCSKCNGNYEYCQDHLFSHKHVE